jgi:RNA polymerase sigma factor (TIGR02999 family)
MQVAHFSLMNAAGEITQLLDEIGESSGRSISPAAMDRLFALVYEELHSQAHRQRAGWLSARTLNTTALVHEAYEKLMGASEVAFSSRAHFLAVSARAMRQILLDYAKSQRAQKRGGDRDRVSLGDWQLAEVAPEPAFDRLIALDDALTRLKSFNPEGARVVECRFFAGMTVEEAAAALGVSEPTVKRRWRSARAWLLRELEGDLGGLAEAE